MLAVRSLRSPDAACGGAAEAGVSCSQSSANGFYPLHCSCREFFGFSATFSQAINLRKSGSVKAGERMQCIFQRAMPTIESRVFGSFHSHHLLSLWSASRFSIFFLLATPAQAPEPFSGAKNLRFILALNILVLCQWQVQRKQCWAKRLNIIL